ncbi:MAG TPA: oligoribonuclease [Gammaproteobacteria bacterium]|nr:oligoribonuclease [Gammaproteobacteria bacterium]
MADKDWNLIWVDLEMTGLDLSVERILEIATVVTDSELNIIAEGPHFVIHQSDAQLAAMNEWNTQQHTKTGLVDAVRKSTITEAYAEQASLDFLKQHVNPQKSPMCGNTICTDRQFLKKYMPQLEQFFHYRHIDVSTLKELAKRWAKSVAVEKKNSTHRALDDIRESIDELKFYRRELLKS